MSLAADLVVVRARAGTMSPDRPEAAALAVRDGRFVVVGDEGEALALRGPGTEVVDARGRRVIPGLHDAHVHMLQFGRGLERLDLAGVGSVADVQRMVRERAAALAPGTWVLGWGWAQDECNGGRFPSRRELDPVAPEHPVALRHKSGHAVWVNTRALELCGVEAHTPDPEGGQIERDKQGQATGILLESALGLLNAHMPAPTERDDLRALRQAQEAAHAYGLTALQCLDGRAALVAYRRLRDAGVLKLRVTSFFSGGQLDGALDAGLRTGFGDEWLRIGPLKLFVDGALGSLTAWMLEPYEGEPGNLGLCTMAPEELHELVSRASAEGIPSAVHAIGDRACREVLNVFARVREEERAQGIAPEQRRHRLEHAQVLAPEDLGRLAELGIVASMQPIHATQDLGMVDRHWGARGRYAYAFATLAQRGTKLAFGSDAPVEDLNPFVGLHAAVTRRRADGSPGPEGWHPGERLSVEEALEAYTVGAAYGVGREQELGRIAPGYLADFLVVDRDILACDPMDIKDARPVMTFVGGVCVYREPRTEGG